MNTVNASTGFSPFQLRLGRSPRILPALTNSPLFENQVPSSETDKAKEMLLQIQKFEAEAQDNLLSAKISQCLQANRFRLPTVPFKVGEKVMLSTKNRRREYMSAKSGRVAK
ncbi:hypothetical protein CPC08DRAFT_589199, partial [Agrocybe pediades]